MARLIKLNPPGNVSLAGAYVLGYGGLAMAQIQGDGPDWFGDLDPLETLFLGTAWPQEFRDPHEFANSCTAWLQLLRGTVHWSGIERFVREALAASEEYDLPVDEGELMFLLAGRLESASLDQRKLPRRLLPGELLEGSRCVFGPAPDIRLPGPLPDAAERIAGFWSAVEVSLPNDGTAADALREGLHMLAAAGLDVRHEPAVLLPALYAGLVADDEEDLSESGDRAVAWALGLKTDSPMVPVTDVMLVAPERDLTVDEILGQLFGIPAFTAQVSPEDRSWHSSPGNSLVGLAFELGYRHVITRDGKAVRMGEESAAVIQAQLRKFEEKFGRPPGPDDPIFFDPDAVEPRSMSLAGVRDATVSMLEAAGTCPAWTYAHERTNGLLPLFDGSFATGKDRSEWEAAIGEYVERHDPGAEIDHEAETRKLQNVLVVGTMQTVVSDPQYAASLVTRMGDAAASRDGDTALMGEYLDAWRDWLIGQLRSDRSILNEACEYARAWRGAELAAQVRAAPDSGTDDDVPVAVLLAAAVAAFPMRATS
ncbi:MAG: hypothetical protein ACRDN0_04300 [Trebonia sp.]